MAGFGQSQFFTNLCSIQKSTMAKNTSKNVKDNQSLRQRFLFRTKRRSESPVITLLNIIFKMWIFCQALYRVDPAPKPLKMPSLGSQHSHNVECVYISFFV